MLYDAVIIGAGPSGLAAAVRLAHFGKKACLVEAHARLGGLNSWHHVGGVEISSGLHAFTNYAEPGENGALAKLLRQLRLKRSDLELCPQKRSSIRFPSATLAFDNNPETIRAQIAAVFPRDIDGFDLFRRRIRETDESAFTAKQQSARAVAEQYIANPLLLDMLFCPIMFYGNPGGVGDGKDAGRSIPDMDWLLFCVVWKCIFETGFAIPAEGMRPLWEKLAQRFLADGGELRMADKVKAIGSDNGSLAVTLADGETLSAKTVFSSAGLVETSLLSGLPVCDEDTGRISIVEGVSILNQPIACAGLTDATVFYNFENSLAFGRPQELVEQRSGVICAAGNYAVPEDKRRHVLKVSQLASYPAWKKLDKDEYRSAKQQAGENMAVNLARLGVDLSLAKNNDGKYGFFDDIFTPLTLERFTSHSEGALYGSPRKSRDGVTPVPGLYLIGADQGFHGIVGAMLSGIAMANRHILAKS